MRTLTGATLLTVLATGSFAQQPSSWMERPPSPADFVSARECHPPGDVKEAQVLALDKVSLEAKLAVSVASGEFKVVTVKLWDRPDDPRPIIPVVEAARITQGKLQFFTPNLEADPEPVHDRGFLLSAVLGGARVCWATEGALLRETAGSKAPTAPAAVSAAEPRRSAR